MPRTSLRPLPVFLAGSLLSALFISLAATLADAGEFTNHAGVRMVDIPAGSFMMGSCKLTEANRQENKKRGFLGLPPLTPHCANADPDAADNETPQHRVTLRAFQMSRTEVTLGQFKKYLAATGRIDLVNEKFMKANDYGDNAPVVWVTWNDAQAFVDWLNSSKPASDPERYRLPSEAEWEYACRAGGNHIYCGSNNANAVAWFYENGGRRPQPVAGKQANAFGLYDMSGNADEWVQDCYHGSYAGAPSDGTPWSTGCGSNGQVLRGSSWNRYEAKYTRAAQRGEHAPGAPNGLIGFRIARSVGLETFPSAPRRNSKEKLPIW